MASRQQTLTFITDSGGTQTLTIQDVTDSTDVVFFNGTEFDEAIDGSLRSNLRGIRKSFNISYKLCSDSDTFRSIVDNIVTDLESGSPFVYCGIDTNELFRVTLDDGLAERITYNNQIGLHVPTLALVGTEVNQTLVVLDVEDWRFVNESVTESRDYGLITESVTTQIDYGFIV